MSELLIDWTTPGQTPCCCERVCEGGFPEGVQFVKEVSKTAWDLATRDEQNVGMAVDYLATYPSGFGIVPGSFGSFETYTTAKIAEAGRLFSYYSQWYLPSGPADRPDCEFSSGVTETDFGGTVYRRFTLNQQGIPVQQFIADVELTAGIGWTIYLRQTNNRYYIGLVYESSFRFGAIRIDTQPIGISGSSTIVGSIQGQATILENPPITITRPLYASSGVESLTFAQPTVGFFVSLFGAP